MLDRAIRLSCLCLLVLAQPPHARADPCAPAERIFADGFEPPSPPVSPLQLAFTAQPAGGAVGAMLAPIAVSVADACGAIVAGKTVTLAKGVDPSGRATLAGTLAVASGASGVATFSDLALDWAGPGYTLIASAQDGPNAIAQESEPFAETRVGDACLGPDQPCDCTDVDGDGLNDLWENAGGADANGDGEITDARHDVLLPGASASSPDVYVAYDWMDYGPDDQSCSTANDCVGLGRAHLGESCGALGSPFEAQCYYACALDADCASRSPTDAHAGERCVDGACRHTHDPLALGADPFAPVVAAFAAHGIALHIVRGAALPHSHVVSLRNDAQMTVGCEGANLASGGVGIGKYAVGYYALKPTPPAAVAYHHALFAHYTGCDSNVHCQACPGGLSYGQTGIAYLSGEDLIVSLGGQVNDTGVSPRYLGPATLMHELGHNLGMHHEGHIDTPCHDDGECAAGDSCADIGDGQGKACHQLQPQPNYKPNYLSVMNYRYQGALVQFAGSLGSRVPKACGTDGDCGGVNAVCVRRDAESRCSLSARVCTNVADCPLANETCVAPPAPFGNCATNGYACTQDGDCQPGDTCVAPAGPGTCARIDYSAQVLPTGGATPGALDESSLDDTVGLGSGNADLFTYTDALCHVCWVTAPSQGAVNWGGVGIVPIYNCSVIQTGPESYGETNVQADVDAPDGIECDPAPTDVLLGHADWPDVSGVPFNYRFLCPIVDPPMAKRAQLRRTWVP